MNTQNITKEYSDIDYPQDSKISKEKSSYKKTLDRVLRSNNLSNINEENEFSFKESKSFKNFFERLDKKLDKNINKEKILW
jgi:hypothetical protein